MAQAPSLTGGVYGQMTLYWPEQHIPFTYFDMGPQINDGYGPITVLSSGYTGVRHNDISSAKDSNGNLVQFVKYYLWAIPALMQGKFVSFQDNLTDGNNYRIIHASDWPQPGGYYLYELDKIVGSNGGTTVNEGWSDGSGNFK